MTIRSKLLAGYGATLIVAVVVGVSSLLALLSWRESANTLTTISSQRVLSERIRSDLMFLIGAAVEFAEGEAEHQAIFWKTDGQITALLQTLQDSSHTEIERDHIAGLRETHDELIWIVRRTIEEMADDFSASETTSERITIARSRLDEIATEVTDDMAVLNQFYRDEAKAALALANSATTMTTYIVIGVGIASTVSLLLAMFLMRRWLSAPIAGITNATSSISAGNFAVRAPENSQDEWGALGRDINRMAESLRHFESRLREQERLVALGEVAAYAAHNIRNPLAGVRAAAQVLQVELPDSESGAHASLAEMIGAIDRLDVWVKRMMTFANPLDFHPQPTAINETLESTLHLSRSEIAESHIQLECRLASGLPLVSADSSLLEQAYSAILSNAIEAVSEPGRIVIQSEKVSVDREGEYVRVTFSDNGSGVAEEMQDKLFRLFASGKDNGSGLGLAQAKRIFEAHRGSIHIQSSQGQGCTVITEIPTDESLCFTGNSGSQERK